MLIILVCVVFISFSTDTITTSEVNAETKLAVYIPILFSFTVPCAQAANIMIAKRVTTVLGVSPWDYTIGCYCVMACMFQIWGLFYWFSNPGKFDLYYLILGAIGSLLQVIGVLCLNLAITTAKAAGPAIAIVSTQMIVLTMASAVLAGLVPNFMQWMGLVFGLLGAMVLVIPDKVKSLVPCLE
jgi:drug/metabolite transporter (DMT)-like permease